MKWFFISLFFLFFTGCFHSPIDDPSTRPFPSANLYNTNSESVSMVADSASMYEKTKILYDQSSDNHLILNVLPNNHIWVQYFSINKKIFEDIAFLPSKPLNCMLVDKKGLGMLLKIECENNFSNKGDKIILYYYIFDEKQGKNIGPMFFLVRVEDENSDIYPINIDLPDKIPYKNASLDSLYYMNWGPLYFGAVSDYSARTKSSKLIKLLAASVVLGGDFTNFNTEFPNSGYERSLELFQETGEIDIFLSDLDHANHEWAADAIGLIETKLVTKPAEKDIPW